MNCRPGSNFCCVAVRERFCVETACELLGSRIDAAVCHVLVKDILAFGVEISLRPISLNGRLNSSGGS